MFARGKLKDTFFAATLPADQVESSAKIEPVSGGGRGVGGQRVDMDARVLREYCLQQPGAVEELPVGRDVQVFKVMGQTFALIPTGGELSISLKCDPQWSTLLRDNYPAVQPAYHLDERHWNTVALDGSLADDKVLEMVRHSYHLVVDELTTADREALKRLTDRS